jgi:hypothetical protein
VLAFSGFPSSASGLADPFPPMPLSSETKRIISENEFQSKREKGQLTKPRRGAVRFRTARQTPIRDNYPPHASPLNLSP